jgi:hypothetical protein
MSMNQKKGVLVLVAMLVTGAFTVWVLHFIPFGFPYIVDVWLVMAMAGATLHFVATPFQKRERSEYCWWAVAALLGVSLAEAPQTDNDIVAQVVKYLFMVLQWVGPLAMAWVMGRKLYRLDGP